MKLKLNADPFSLTAGNSKLNSYQVRSRPKGRWFEVDSFTDRKNRTGNGSVGFYIDEKIINLWLWFVIFCIFILVVRVAYLQLYRSSYFSSVAEGNRIRIADIKATRGVIYDRFNKLLVENFPVFSLAVIPVDLPKTEAEKNQLIKELAKLSGQSEPDINKLIGGQKIYSYQPVILKENLTQDEAILARVLSSHFSSVVLQANESRHYLMAQDNPGLSHVLGYEGKIEENKLDAYLNQGYSFDDYVGKAGVELTYETELKGVNGKEQVEVDATGQAKEILAQQKPVSGKNLVLTIDADLQKVAETSLAKTLAANHKQKGVVIALDPNSGEVLALVSLPSFDNNLFSKALSQQDSDNLFNNPDQPLFFRAISGEYPPGSTFKLIISAAALQEGIIDSNTSFQSVGGIRVNQWFFPDWKAGGHGWTNVTKALAESINTFFYIIGGGYNDFKGLGVEKIKKYAEMFGLGKELGIDLPNEGTGFLPSEDWKEKTKNELWYIGDTYHLAIGQGDVTVTPLQIAAWTSVFANGGILYQPHVVKAILDSENKPVTEVKPKILNQGFISPKNIDIVSQGLRQAVLSGSAKSLQSLPITSAAKTGTAQWSTTKSPQAWFTAYAPYESPKIVVTVLVEEGGEGSTVGLPIAKEVLDWWAKNRQ
ncbi:MAG: penicillin-binding protein 2 [Patescibacteria group bacterium]|jgi:penicillin-binding protein 2